MRNILNSTISLLLIATALIVGCSDDKTDPTFLTMSGSSENITISADGQNASVTLLPMGSSEEITIKSSGKWSFVEEEVDDWCKITQQGDKIIITADEYPSLYDRSTMARIMLPDGTSAIIKIGQKGTEMADVKLDHKSIEFTERGGSQTVQVTANRGWVVTGYEGLDWIEIVVEENSFTVTTSANSIAEDLNLVLTVKAGSTANMATAFCAVMLAQQTPPYIRTDREMLPVSESGGTIRLAVESNREWTVNNTDTWYTTAIEGDEIILTVTAKTQEVNKTGTFKITTASGGDPIEKIITVTQFVNPMIFEYTAATNGATAVLPTVGELNIHIEWGDNSIESRFGNLGLPEIEHTYTASGIYEVKVYGLADRLYYLDVYVEGEVAKLTALKQWGDLGLTNLSRAFQGSSITEVPTGYKDVLKNVTDITHMFADSKLSTIPQDFFEGCSHITATNGMFSRSELSAIPFGLLDGLTGLETAIAMFSYTPITAMPAGLFINQTELTMINTIFKDCTLLKRLRDNMFENSTKLTNVLGAFSGCSSLTFLPETLFQKNTEITNASMTFENCTKITYLPSSLFNSCKKIVNFSRTFSGCTALEDESPGSPIHLYERTVEGGFVVPTMTMECFKGCTGLTDYDSIPGTWK